MKKGQRIGNYHLVNVLGKGGFAQVYLGLHCYLKTPAAIKVLHTHLDLADQQRFLQEAQLIARLDHPHIVRVLDFGVANALPYLVMEYAPMGSLRQHYPQGARMPLSDVLLFVKQMADALQHAHERKIIHRDVKPDNVLLKRSRHVLLSDFGLAVLRQSASSQGLLQAAGTVAYSAPEQLLGQPAPASDQYALAVSVYEWLTGQRPFEGSVDELFLQHRQVAPPPLRQRCPDIAAAVEAVVLRALAKDPRDRWPDVLAFAAALQEAIEPQRVECVEVAAIPVAAIPASALPPPDERPHVWTVPFARNPYFTGRELIFDRLQRALHSQDITALTQPHAVSGLGGVGKTQTAVEYAYRYRDEYHSVFWIHAETRDTAYSDLAQLADLLHLPEQDAQDMGRRVAAVKRWLAAHSGWLLILDNVEDNALLADVLPSPLRGDALLTTRSQVLVPLARRIDLDEMFPEEGAVFLLRRAGLVASDVSYGAIPSALRMEAKAIAEALDGLPLALDQAGAYIEETGCSLSDYLERYHTSRAALLRRRGGGPTTDHPESVAATWSLSFERIKQQNAAAADLLAVCAFLPPDAIPEEIIREGASELGPHLGHVAVDPLELDEAIRDLRQFSLVRRDSENRMLSIHRLVQTVLREAMDEQEQRLWTERVVRAVSRVFPASGEDVAQWHTCERLMPQVRVCTELLDEFVLASPQAARLCHQAGLYAMDQARYRLAEELLKKALGIHSLLHSKHPASGIDVAEAMNDLGIVYSKQKEYVKAEALMRQALALFEQIFGSYHADVAVVTTNVALQLLYQEKYVEAEPLFIQALSIWQHHAVPEEFAHIACTTNNLAKLYVMQGQLTRAEQYFRQALTLWEHVKGPEHPDVARTLTNLARLYRDQGRHAEAESLFLRARAIREQRLGPDHPDTAQTLHDLAVLYLKQDRFTEAEPLFQLALEIRELALGNDHPLVMGTLTDYALLLRNNGRVAEADRMMQQVITIQPDSVSER